jgi:hypothetical protein
LQLSLSVAEYELDDTRICNVDETAFHAIQKPQKILALRGKLQAGDITKWRGAQTLRARARVCVCVPHKRSLDVCSTSNHFQMSST